MRSDLPISECNNGIEYHPNRGDVGYGEESLEVEV